MLTKVGGCRQFCETAVTRYGLLNADSKSCRNIDGALGRQVRGFVCAWASRLPDFEPDALFYFHGSGLHQGQIMNEDKCCFIHSALDDFGLTQSEFRVFCHIARKDNCGDGYLDKRTNKLRYCDESVGKMAKTCRINKDILRRTLNALVEKGMVERKLRHKKPTIYKTVPWPSHWKKIVTPSKKVAANLPPCTPKPDRHHNPSLGAHDNPTLIANGNLTDGNLKGNPLRKNAIKEKIVSDKETGKHHPKRKKKSQHGRNLNNGKGEDSEAKRDSKKSVGAAAAGPLVPPELPPKCSHIIVPAGRHGWDGGKEYTREGWRKRCKRWPEETDAEHQDRLTFLWEIFNKGKKIYE